MINNIIEIYEGLTDNVKKECAVVFGEGLEDVIYNESKEDAKLLAMNAIKTAIKRNG